MKIEYDNEVDALQILFASTKPEDSRDVAEGVTIDLDENGNIVGMEILEHVDNSASKRSGGSLAPIMG